MTTHKIFTEEEKDVSKIRPIEVVEYNGEYYIMNGNHRAAYVWNIKKHDSIPCVLEKLGFLIRFKLRWAKERPLTRLRVVDERGKKMSWKGVLRDLEDETGDGLQGINLEVARKLVEIYQGGGSFDYRKEWAPHTKKNKKNIMKAVKTLKGGTIILLGAGSCINEPLKKLAKKFDKVILIDLDEEGMQKAKKSLPKKLQEKIIIKTEDITGISLDVMKEVRLIIEEKYSDDEEKTFNALRDLLLRNSTIDVVILPDLMASCDFVISSLVISNLARFPLFYIEEEFRKHFGDSSEIRFGSPQWREVKNQFTSAIEKAHINLLRNLVKDGGRVFVSDTTAGYNIKGLNILTPGEFFISGGGRKIHSNDLRKILEESFIVEEENSWEWLIKQPLKTIPGSLSEVKAFSLIPDQKVKKVKRDELKRLHLLKTKI